MIKKIAKVFGNAKLKNKLLIIYFGVSIVPMVFLVILSTNLLGSIIREKDEGNIRTYLDQAAYSVDSELIAYNSISDYNFIFFHGKSSPFKCSRYIITRL